MKLGTPLGISLETTIGALQVVFSVTEILAAKSSRDNVGVSMNGAGDGGNIGLRLGIRVGESVGFSVIGFRVGEPVGLSVVVESVVEWKVV